MNKIKRNYQPLISGLLLGSLLSFIGTSCNHKKTATTTKDSVELSDSLNNPKEDAKDTIQGKRPDLVDKAVMQRNEQSEYNQILSKINSKIDTGLLFGIWTTDPTGPHADFVLSKNSYYIVDYDGDGDMRYELIGNDLKIYFKDFTKEGNILSVDRDSLKIKWKHSDQAENYVRWKQ